MVNFLTQKHAMKIVNRDIKASNRPSNHRGKAGEVGGVKYQPKDLYTCI